MDFVKENKARMQAALVFYKALTPIAPRQD